MPVPAPEATIRCARSILSMVRRSLTAAVRMMNSASDLSTLFSSIIILLILAGRLVAGLRPLKPSTEVRILSRQPIDGRLRGILLPVIDDVANYSLGL